MTQQLVGEAYLIVDTNLFLECRALDELPWNELGYASIDLIVSRTVQQELDAHAKNDRGRTYKQALAARTLLRKLVTGGEGALTVRDAMPRVTLRLMPTSRLQPELNDALDPTLPDDAIILRMLQFQLENKERSVSLLTHDTGPMATASSLGIPYIPIPDSWLKREQNDAAAKEIERLKADIKRLQAQEPRIQIRVLNAENAEIVRLDSEVESYEAIDGATIELLMEDLRRRFPPATEFGSPETTPQPRRPYDRPHLTYTKFVPASAADIQAYRDEAYPRWLETCRKRLEVLHLQLNARVDWPNANFLILNSGTRPAESALVRFIAHGNVEILSLESGDNDTSAAPEIGTESVKLPNPPSPPRGEWRQQNASSLDLIEEFAGRHSHGRSVIGGRLGSPLLQDFDIQSQNDPELFYWRNGRPTTPSSLLELTCKKWRHGGSEECFPFRVTSSDSRVVTGAVRCEVHAANLSDPVVLTVPVRIERVSKSTIAHARQLAGRLRVS